MSLLYGALRTTTGNKRACHKCPQSISSRLFLGLRRKTPNDVVELQTPCNLPAYRLRWKPSSIMHSTTSPHLCGITSFAVKASMRKSILVIAKVMLLVAMVVLAAMNDDVDDEEMTTTMMAFCGVFLGSVVVVDTVVRKMFACGCLTMTLPSLFSRCSTVSYLALRSQSQSPWPGAKASSMAAHWAWPSIGAQTSW